MSLQALNDRSRQIFRQIVETYLETGEPVGSRTISRADGIHVSPATIRNVMADMEEAGLLEAPHTSAGRVPTDLGLRIFVDGLMQVGNLTTAERASLEARAEESGLTTEDLLAQATRKLSGLSHCASVVLVPKEDDGVRHIEFVPLAPDRALVIIVSENGHVENRLIDLPPGLPATALIQAGNYLNQRLAGRTLTEARAMIEEDLANHKTALDVLAADVVEKGLAVWSGADEDKASLIISGQANLIDDVTASEDLERLRRLFEDLERKRDLVRLLELARQGEGVRLYIGSETNLFSLSGSSLIVSPYMKGADNVVGVIGVIGPTRLNYARIIPMVDYTAQVISGQL